MLGEHVFPKPSSCAQAGYYLVVPILVAMALDDGPLARAPAPAPARPTVTPSLVVKPGLALLGLGGTF
ncbi:MAG TPA: hypothetical protein VKZ18_07075 [Polyangia bacterium]|nr:hypothetical protein [Polyangia bacterium]